MSEEQNTEEQSGPLGSFLWGGGMLILAVVAYFYFGHLEAEGGSVRINWIIALVYNFAGKTGVAAGLGLLSALYFFFGFSELSKAKKLKEEEEK